MIGKISTGRNFRGCLRYLHEGRLQESEELQLEEMAKKQAEVIHYNKCFGTREQVAKQLVEVRALNPKLLKPVLHASFSFAYADAALLTQQQKADIAIAMSEEFGFDQNQFIVITHADTVHEHIHILVNRVGYDGKTVNDSNSYKRMAQFCRDMEKRYKLTPVLSPNRFLASGERMAIGKRVDHRKELLKKTLVWAISESGTIETVKIRMQERGYHLHLGRGITFTDKQQIRFNGSQVGYSLADINAQLIRQRRMAVQEKQQQMRLREQTKSEKLTGKKAKGRSI
ncbi:relaxase/mobilization nuclease domain-containing protein [Pedobacter steynii]